MTSLDEDRCGVCGGKKGSHEGLNHRFSAEGVLLPPIEPTRPESTSSIDIPLRLVLLDKGLITVEDLTVKEAELRDRITQARRDALDSSDLGHSD